MSPGSSATPAAFVVLGGPDGVGKTTVARAILDAVGRDGRYFHFRPPLRGELPTGPGPARVRAKAPAGGPRPLGWVRLIRSSLLCWMGYVRSVKPALSRGELVVGDRWIYGYVAQPASLRFSGPVWLARLGIRLAPKPDLLVNLTAPSDVIRDRKQELTHEQIERELGLWRGVAGPRTMTVDALQAPSTIAAEVLDRLRR